MPNTSNTSNTSNANRIHASYLIETPLDPAQVAEVMAGEQSCGTFAGSSGVSIR